MSNFFVGFPSLSRYDLLLKAVEAINKSSIKPSAIFIQDNGKSCPKIESDIKTYIIQSPYNLGVAATWNKLWDLAGDDKMFIINDDIKVAESTLQTMLDANTDLVLGLGYSLFLVTPELRKKVGSFDERFWPAYWEDIDYHLRVERTDATVTKLTFDDVEHMDSGSATYKDNKWMEIYLTENKHKMYRKWGLTEAEEAKMRRFQPFYTIPVPNIIDPFEEYMQYGRYLPKTEDFGGAVLSWLGF